MLFSERYGYKKINEALLRENMPEYLRTRIWNVFYNQVFVLTRDGKDFWYKELVETIWDGFFKKPLDELHYYPSSHGRDKIKELFFQLSWYEVYDFIEFFAQFAWESWQKDLKKQVLQEINIVLRQERAPYRIINDIVTPLTSEEEIKEIEKALSVSDKFKPVRDHLEKALRLMSDRKDPDYENSIKESISALESLVQILRGKRGTLGKLIDELNIHPALKEGFRKLYGWASDEEGIRHGKFGEPFDLGFAEARYMFITISAFVNYLIEKLGDKIRRIK